jgi:hypothetical protein
MNYRIVSVNYRIVSMNYRIVSVNYRDILVNYLNLGVAEEEGFIGEAASIIKNLN